MFFFGFFNCFFLREESGCLAAESLPHRQPPVFAASAQLQRAWHSVLRGRGTAVRIGRDSGRIMFGSVIHDYSRLFKCHLKTNSIYFPPYGYVCCVSGGLCCAGFFLRSDPGGGWVGPTGQIFLGVLFLGQFFFEPYF